MKLNSILILLSQDPEHLAILLSIVYSRYFRTPAVKFHFSSELEASRPPANRPGGWRTGLAGSFISCNFEPARTAPTGVFTLLGERKTTFSCKDFRYFRICKKTVSAEKIKKKVVCFQWLTRLSTGNCGIIVDFVHLRTAIPQATCRIVVFAEVFHNESTASPQRFHRLSTGKKFTGGLYLIGFMALNPQSRVTPTTTTEFL